MKHLLLLLISATVSLISVNGKIPDYIQICKRTDPEISKCIKNSVLKLRDNLVHGIPELAVPSIDPLHMERLTFNLGPGFKAQGQDLTIKGGQKFEIRELNADITANIYNFTVFIPQLISDGTYLIDATIAGIPLKGKGPFRLTANSVLGRGVLRGKTVMRDGKTYNWYPSMSMKLEVGDYNVKLENLFEGDPTIGEVTNKLLNDEKDEVLKTTLPAFEKALSEYFLLCANNIVKTFTWDELFS